jgi:hypothetical protein
MRGRALGIGVASLLALVARARIATADSAEASAVWYRAAAECPSGADFLAKIEGSPRAHLAQGGEHIDFVVTLLTSGAETVGRLRTTNQRRNPLGLTRRVRLEAAAEAMLPVLREQVFAASRALYQDAIIAFYGSDGVSFGLP